MIVLVLACLFLACTVQQIVFFASRSRNASRSWEDLLLRLQPVNQEAIKALLATAGASDYMNRDDVKVFWKGLGGFAGTRRLNHNAKAMLDLAVFAERWEPNRNSIFSAMIRRDALRLRRATQKLQLAALLRFALPLSAEMVSANVACYCDMSGRLLGIYENSHAGLLPRLAAVL